MKRPTPKQKHATRKPNKSSNTRSATKVKYPSPSASGIPSSRTQETGQISERKKSDGKKAIQLQAPLLSATSHSLPTPRSIGKWHPASQALWKKLQADTLKHGSAATLAELF